MTVESQGGVPHIVGTLSTTALAQIYRIDFYASPSCDEVFEGPQYGEGANWLGSTNVTTSLDGLADIDFAAPSITPATR